MERWSQQLAHGTRQRTMRCQSHSHCLLLQPRYKIPPGYCIDLAAMKAPVPTVFIIITLQHNLSLHRI